MTSFTQLLAGLERGGDGRIEAHVPDDWMQGRTTYGGLTAALSFEGARALAENMPLRAAQVAFVGPVGGEVVISSTLLRRGKNTAFVSTDVVGAGGVAARSIFAFGAGRASAHDLNMLEAPKVPGPEASPSHFHETRRPRFAEHFNVRRAAGAAIMSGAAEADLTFWLRHKDEGALYDATTLLALGDAPPPAAMSLFKEPGMISSMTWMAEFLTDRIETDNGWFLARHVAQTARDGYSSQSMRMWNTAGQPVMAGRQTIAMFV